MNFEYTIIRSGRKTVGFEVKKDGTVLVRVPQCMTNKEVAQFVEEHSDWIERHLEMAASDRAKEEAAGPVQPLTTQEIRALANEALIRIPERVKYYAARMGVMYGRITIRNQKTRWGSCSEKGNLNFNCLLMLMPDEIIDYVVVHELAHRLQMNHSKEFWCIVETELPDYRDCRAWLSRHGDEYMKRMTG